MEKKKNKIGWLNAPGYIGETWNPIVGCDKVSEGCENCYAENMARRLSGMGKTQYIAVINSKGKWNGSTCFVTDAVDKPTKWKKPRLIFVCSMGDLFHKSVSFNHVDRIMEIIKSTPQHTYIVLTKRPDIMFRYFASHANPPSNIFFGVSAENQKRLEERIPYLFYLKAAVKFVSIEPMIDEVDLDVIVIDSKVEVGDKTYYTKKKAIDLVDWVIVGGESGHKARPLLSRWVIKVKELCEKTKTPFFFKQGSQANWNNYKNIDSFPLDLKIREFPNYER